LKWNKPYFVDADHINGKNVEPFLEPCDFFTIDVADYVGRSAEESFKKSFLSKYNKFFNKVIGTGRIKIQVKEDNAICCVEKYLQAIAEAGKIYRKIEQYKGKNNFVVEISMDETDEAQSPGVLFFILAAIADEKIPAQTIAPKFTGRFNKGVDYVGDLKQFQKEFAEDIAAIALAKKEFGLPENLKLSVHSGSDKFSIYPIIKQIICKTHSGLHLKTAGTTWLEEYIGLAECGAEGLEIAKEIYAAALKRYDELCLPYASVIDIRKNNLPDERAVALWKNKDFVDALKHNVKNPAFNPDMRQFIHVSYKLAAEMKERYYKALELAEEQIAHNVAENIFERHLKPLFL
jgi:hypothetical protein